MRGPGRKDPGLGTATIFCCSLITFLFFFSGCQMILFFFFPLQFLTSGALHCATVDIIYDVVRVVAYGLGGPQDLFNGSRKFSS